MLVDLHQYLDSYRLVDCGDGKKLEQFANVVVIRPDISAVDKPQLPYSKWLDMAHAEFVECRRDSGSWKLYRDLPPTWDFHYATAHVNVTAILSLASSKHVGIFPEQVLNWRFLEQLHGRFPQFDLLNLFGYTGVTSIVAAAFARQVTHVDVVRKVVERTKQNAAASHVGNVRFITEDARRFVVRELKRNRSYHGLILDPPAVGVANSKMWSLSNDLFPLLTNAARLLSPKAFVIMNLYSKIVDNKLIDSILRNCFPDFEVAFCDKIFGLTNAGNKIDHGYFIRLTR